MVPSEQNIDPNEICGVCEYQGSPNPYMPSVKLKILYHSTYNI